jgi:hypothetical protein
LNTCELQGRKKRGSIYVFPDGSDGITGNGAANSIYTIAVNNVGVRGTLLENHEVSACVITSGLGNGNSLHTNFMVIHMFNFILFVFCFLQNLF